MLLPFRLACVDTRLSYLGVVNLLTKSPNGLRMPLVSLVETIISGEPESKQLFLQQYGSGLRFLARRKCPNQANECFETVVNESITAILNGLVSRDEDLPGLIRATLQRASLSFDPPSNGARTSAEVPSVSAGDQIEVERQLTIFTPVQLEGLFRFYVKLENASVVCHELGLNQEQFDFIRAAARQAARLGSEVSAASKREVSRRATTADGNRVIEALHPIAEPAT